MSDDPERGPDEDPTTTALRRKARRMRRRGERPRIFAHLAHVGVLGWVFILPLVGLTYLGHLAGRAIGATWPAVAGLLVWLALGVYVTWRNVKDGVTERTHDEEGP